MVYIFASLHGVHKVVVVVHDDAMKVSYASHVVVDMVVEAYNDVMHDDEMVHPS